MSNEAEFSADVADESTGFSATHDDSDRIVVVFGGLVGAGFLGIPPFEFANLLADMPATKLFLRDLDQAWYHHGVRGLADSLPSLIDALRPHVADRRRAVFVGHSSGGFGALIAGCVLGVDEIIATSPQTFLSPWLRRLHRERRWAAEIERTYRLPTVERRMLDTKPWVRRSPRRTRIQIHFGEANPGDAIHARRLARFGNVAVQSQPFGGHSVARFMRDEGILLPMLRRAIEGG